MFKNKIKYSLLIGSLYNVKCDYIFNVYINGKKTSISKTIEWNTLCNICEGNAEFDFEENKFASYKEYKKNHSSYKKRLDAYLQRVLFYKESQEGGILENCFYDDIMKHSIEGMKYYTSGVSDKQILEYEDIKDDSTSDIKIEVYYVKKAEYKILNETEVLSKDFINSLNVSYEKYTVEDAVILFLKNIKNINYCLTYKQLLEKLSLFDVYIDGEQIKEDDNKYITPEEAKKLYLLPKLEFQNKKKIKLEFDNNDHKIYKNITIPSYVTLKYIKESSYYNSKCKGKICYDISHHEGLEFYKDSTYNDKIGDNDIVKGNIYVKVKQYFVTTFTDKIFPLLLNTGKFVDVDKLNDYINEYKKNKDLIGKKHYISPVIESTIFESNFKYEDCLTNHICVFVNSKINETKEELKEEHIEELKEELKNKEILIETPKEEFKDKHIEKPKSEHKEIPTEEPKEETPTEEPKTTEHNPIEEIPNIPTGEEHIENTNNITQNTSSSTSSANDNSETKEKGGKCGKCNYKNKK